MESSVNWNIVAAQFCGDQVGRLQNSDGEEKIVRIAFDYQTFVLQSYGGISRYFSRLASGMSDIGQDVNVFAPFHRNVYLSELPRNISHGQYVSSFLPKTTRVLLMYNQVRSRLQIAKWKPAVMHETYYARSGSSEGRCPVVITVHDMIHELFPQDFSVNDNTAAIKRLAIERADHIICVSENTRLDLMRLNGISASKLSVVHHGFDKLMARRDLQQSDSTSGKPFLLYVGQRAGYKNFDGFLKSVASSNRLLCDFDIVAFGGPPFAAGELQAISSLGFKENQVRQQSGNDILLGSMYNSARALVYPSLYEGFGIPPLEAMAHQCPVVSSNTSSMPEVVGSAGEYFEPTSNDDIRRAIEAVAYSDSRIESLRRSGAERITAFSWEKCVQETLSIYGTLV